MLTEVPKQQVRAILDDLFADPDIKELCAEINGRAFGLTKREMFAAMAMQGILSSWPMNSEMKVEGVAQQSGAFADALLAELAKEPKK